MSHVPFKVHWQLRAPVIVPSLPIHLDALLSWARVQEELERGNVDALALQHDIPLSRHECRAGWCFMASMLEFDYTASQQQLHFVKTSDIDEFAREFERGAFGRRRPAFDPVRGLTKAGNFVMYEAFAASATAYGIGDVDHVRDLLSRVHSIGKLRRCGKGSVRQVDVHPCEEAAQRWAWRNLPFDSPHAAPGSHFAAQQRLHSPYWSKERHTVLAPAVLPPSMRSVDGKALSDVVS